MNKNDDYIKNPIDGRSLFKPFMPISGVIIFILIMLIYRNCRDNKSTNEFVRTNQDIFIYVNKKTLDTSKFYGYKNIDTAIVYAKKERKNILLIFSGYSCMSENGKEWKTLSVYGDNNKIQNNFIIAWLAVDDRRTAKDTNQFVFWYGKNRKLIEIGDQNKYFEESVFNQSTQPLFCFIDTSKKAFGKTIGYTPDKKEVEAFINSGLKN